jgi:hypothetical protein
MKVKIRYILFGVLVLTGLGIGVFVPFTTIVKTAKSVTKSVSQVIAPTAIPDRIRILKDPQPVQQVTSVPVATITSGFDNILNYIQRIVGFISTMVGAFLGIRTLRGEQKKKRTAPTTTSKPIPTGSGNKKKKK